MDQPFGVIGAFVYVCVVLCIIANSVDYMPRKSPENIESRRKYMRRIWSAPIWPVKLMFWITVVGIPALLMGIISGVPKVAKVIGGSLKEAYGPLPKGEDRYVRSEETNFRS